jgi:hypothetical protein
MVDGRSHVLFQGLMGSAKVVLQLELRFKAGVYEMRGGALEAGGRWRTTAWRSVSDSPHTLAFSWRAAAGAPDGSLALAVDGSEVARIDGLNNVGLRMDFVRLGAVGGLDAGTLGSMYFDGFESWRTPIP